VPDVDAIGRGILADDEEFLHPRLDQLLRFAQHRMGGAADEAAPHVGNDAETAVVIAAFGNLQVAVVPWRQLDPCRGQEVHERVGSGRHGGVDGVQHLLVLLRSGDGQH
jgi:hypothetical protein